MVTRTLNHANVHVPVVQEVKLTDPKFALQTGFGYKIHVIAAGSGNCKGVSLLVRESNLFDVEEMKV